MSCRGGGAGRGAWRLGGVSKNTHEVHYDSVTEEVPPGYTFGYNVHKQPQTARLRRLDKIHITSRLGKMRELWFANRQMSSVG